MPCLLRIVVTIQILSFLYISFSFHQFISMPPPVGPCPLHLLPVMSRKKQQPRLNKHLFKVMWLISVIQLFCEQTHKQGQYCGLRFDSGCGLSAWSLYVLPVLAWVFSWFSGFLPHSKDIHVR